MRRADARTVNSRYLCSMDRRPCVRTVNNTMLNYPICSCAQSCFSMSCLSHLSRHILTLNWEPLASQRRAARLVLFYKIHYGLVAMNMPLESKYHPEPTRKENSLAYRLPSSSVDYQKN